jgi:hypothetical protein
LKRQGKKGTMDYRTADSMNMEIDEVRRIFGEGLITCDEYVKKLYMIISAYLEHVEDTQDMDW